MFKIHHVALSVSDMKKSISFYNVFGFRKVLSWESDDGTLSISHLKLNEFVLEIFCYKKFSEMPKEFKNVKSHLKTLGVKHFGLQVSSIEDAKKKFVDLGFADNISIAQGRTGIKYFFLLDPDGICLEIVQDDRGFN